MRFRAISSLALSIAVCNIVLGTVLSGCSGGHTSSAPGSPTPTPTPTPTPAVPTKVQTTIVWGQRSRQASTGSSVAIAGLPSASSALITLTGAQSGGGNVVFTANRPAGAAGVAQTYTSTSSAIPGTYLLTVQFYNLPLTVSGAVDPSAVVVGTAQANALVQSDGTISATIATAGKIRSIKIIAGQQVPLGQTADIQYTAYGDPTSTGAPVIIPVSAGVALVSVTNQTAGAVAVASVVNGSVDGLYPGKAVVTLTVDNVSSSSSDPGSVITVVSNATVAITPNVTSTLVGAKQTFTASVAPSTVNQTVVWSLAAGAPAGASIDAGTGIFTAPNASSSSPITIIATSVYDPTKTGTAIVTIASNVVLTPTGGSTTIPIGANKTVALPVTVTGTSNTGLTYAEVKGSVQGTLDSSNNYTAPNATGTDTVVVTSQADTSKTLTFNITVGPSITIAPHSSTVSVGQTVAYSAVVVGGTTGNVTYSASGGTLTAGTGNTASYTPPASSGTYTVTVTSVDFPTLSDTATVIVQSGSGVIVVN